MYFCSRKYIGEENGNPLQYCWLENPRYGSLVGCHLWGRTESDLAAAAAGFRECHQPKLWVGCKGPWAGAHPWHQWRPPTTLSLAQPLPLFPGRVPHTLSFPAPLSHWPHSFQLSLTLRLNVVSKLHIHSDEVGVLEFLCVATENPLSLLPMVGTSVCTSDTRKGARVPQFCHFLRLILFGRLVLGILWWAIRRKGIGEEDKRDQRRS